MCNNQNLELVKVNIFNIKIKGYNDIIYSLRFKPMAIAPHALNVTIFPNSQLLISVIIAV